MEIDKSCVHIIKNIWKWGRLLYCIKIRHTWPMLSISWTPCWVCTNAPCSLHNLFNTWREAFGHLLLPSSSLNTRSSPERFLFPADLVMHMLTMTRNSAKMCFFLYDLAFLLQAKLRNKCMQHGRGHIHHLPLIKLHRRGNKIDEWYLNVSKRYLIMFCRASWSSLTPVLWNLCPEEQQKTSCERGTQEDGLLQVKKKILRKDWLTAEISAESTPLVCPWR